MTNLNEMLIDTNILTDFYNTGKTGQLFVDRLKLFQKTYPFIYTVIGRDELYHYLPVNKVVNEKFKFYLMSKIDDREIFPATIENLVKACHNSFVYACVQAQATYRLKDVVKMHNQVVPPAFSHVIHA